MVPPATTAHRKTPPQPRGFRRRRALATIALVPVLLALALFPAGRSLAAPPLFEDGFETGNLSSWTAFAGFSVQTAETHAGTSAVRNTQSAAWAYRQLPTSQTDVYGRVWFKTISHSTSYTLLRFRTGSGGSILRLLVNAKGKLAYLNDAGGVTRTSATVVTTGAWHEAQVHVAIAGSASQVEVWLDGLPIAELTRTENLGTASVGRFEIGNRSTTSSYNVALDDVAVDVAFIGGTPSTPPTPPQNLRLPPESPTTTTTVDLAWDASTDDGTVTGYTIYRDNLQIGTLDGTTTTFQDTNVAPDTKYSYAVVAVDDQGNRSARSGALLVTMPGFVPGTDAVVFAAGDISCSSSVATPTTCRQGPTSDILVNGGPDSVLIPGDIQYPSGTLSTFQTYYDPTWGRVRLADDGTALTRPTPGNHEYGTPGADGYFDYFGAAAGDPTKGYYSYNVGAWHLIALNSNCSKIGGCSTTSAQYTWLAKDLTDNPAACTLAYWHHPRWTSPSEGHSSNISMDPMWDLLVARDADVVLSGHNHHYERFALQDGAGMAAPLDGVRQFVVGSGGKNHVAPTSVAPNSEVLNSNTFGVLKLSLHDDSYAWNFVPEVGSTFTDSGSQACSPLS